VFQIELAIMVVYQARLYSEHEGRVGSSRGY